MKPLALTAMMAVMAATASAQQPLPMITPDVINVTGGTFKNGYYSLDFSVGEATLVNTMKDQSSNFYITNGFLQPYLYGLFDPRPDNHFSEDEVRILPNPTSGISEVNILAKQQGKVRIYLYDRLGKLLYTRENQSYGYGWVERIDLTGQPNGMYMFKVELTPNDGSTPRKGSFKIIKIGR